jgi:hypothetical protein
VRLSECNFLRMGLCTQDCCLHILALTPIHHHELLTPGSGCMQAHLINFKTMATSRNKQVTRAIGLPDKYAMLSFHPTSSPSPRMLWMATSEEKMLGGSGS